MLVVLLCPHLHINDTKKIQIPLKKIQIGVKKIQIGVKRIHQRYTTKIDGVLMWFM